MLHIAQDRASGAGGAMSIQLMTLAWKTKLQVSQKMALLAMCDWANDEGTSLHPSMAKVAERISCSERQAKRIVHSLIESGWLSVVGNVNGGAPGQSRQYKINLAMLSTGDTHVTGDKLSRVTPKVETGDICDTGRVTSATETGDTHVTLTTIEPPIEPPNNHHIAAKPKKSPSAKLGIADLVADGIAEQTAADFLEIRLAKKSPLTKTAMNAIKAEAEKAGYPLESAISECANRGWLTFKAAWVQRDLPANSCASSAKPSRHTLKPASEFAKLVKEDGSVDF